jgi:hypothetical protein
MSKSIRISGKVVYKDLEGGFWGIISDQDYLPINFPEQLKSNGSTVDCYILIDEDIMTMYSWGTPCHIVSFSTIH